MFHGLDDKVGRYCFCLVQDRDGGGEVVVRRVVRGALVCRSTDLGFSRTVGGLRYMWLNKGFSTVVKWLSNRHAAHQTQLHVNVRATYWVIRAQCGTLARPAHTNSLDPCAQYIKSQHPNRSEGDVILHSTSLPILCHAIPIPILAWAILPSDATIYKPNSSELRSEDLVALLYPSHPSVHCIQ